MMTSYASSFFNSSFDPIYAAMLITSVTDSIFSCDFGLASRKLHWSSSISRPLVLVASSLTKDNFGDLKSVNSEGNVS
uniref:Uncharacterized protein n=1 Tax=Lepeophtheirus salmonis TaxID=72036 RepID=A0A0K2UA54_LEPSM